jgi:hypothetical protein
VAQGGGAVKSYEPWSREGARRHDDREKA